MRHPASPSILTAQLAVTLATHAVLVGARAVQVGARRDGLPLYHVACDERDAHIPHALRRWRRGGGARVAAAPRGGTCFQQMCAALHDREVLHGLVVGAAFGRAIEDFATMRWRGHRRSNAGFWGFGAVGPQD